MQVMALLLAAFVAGCGVGEGGGAPPGPGSSSTTIAPGPAGTAGASATAPTVSSASPSSGAAIFSQPMERSTINSSPAGTLSTFTLMETDSGIDVSGTVTMNDANTVATFTPTTGALTPVTSYTATVTTAATSAQGVALANDVSWTFRTGAVPSTPQLTVELGAAGGFAILTKAGITDVPASVITGNVGASPIDGAAIGISCDEVTGTIFAVDAAGPPCSVPDPVFLGTAVSAAETATADAAGRTSPDVVNELGAGEIGGLTLVPGLYKWSTGVFISTDVTLAGGPDDVWIFQISQGITQATDTQVILTGGALPRNVFWQTAGAAAIGTGAHFEGVILSGSSITLGSRASVNGRLIAETDVTLIQNTVTQPAP